MKAQDRLISDWITFIGTGKVALPRFQRFEAWGPSIITDFLSSVMNGLPVGVSLILEVGGKPQFKYRHLEGADDGEGKVKELLLDGQQRLTALWKILNDLYKDKVYFWDLDAGDDNEPAAIYVSRWTNKKTGNKYPLWVEIPKECWNRKAIPFRILNPNNEEEYFNWAEEAVEGDKEAKDELMKVIINLRKNISTFNIPYLFLPAETTKDVAIDVFIKMNTSYVRLTAFDIIVAQVEEATDQPLHQKVEELKAECPEIESYIDTSSYVLAFFALLQNKLPNQRGYFNLDLKRMINEWEFIIKGTIELISFLTEQNIYDYERLPTETVLAPIATIFALSNDDPDNKGNLKHLLKKYIWRSFFTERYDRSIPDRILHDYRSIRKKVIEGIDVEIPIFDEGQYSLPDINLIENAGWPKKKDRLARSILLLSLQKGAKDFADNSLIDRKNIKTREYHHLFPDGFLKKTKQFTEKDIFRALNCALITWKTNRKITDKEPIDYLKERADRSDLGENEIKHRLSTHLIDYSSMEKGDYRQFLETRALGAHQMMHKLCSGIDWE